jgi:hypothetical protein
MTAAPAASQAHPARQPHGAEAGTGSDDGRHSRLISP